MPQVCWAAPQQGVADGDPERVVEFGELVDPVQHLRARHGNHTAATGVHGWWAAQNASGNFERVAPLRNDNWH